MTKCVLGIITEERGELLVAVSPRKRTEGMSSFLFVDDVSATICLRFRTVETSSREEKDDGDSGDIIA